MRINIGYKRYALLDDFVRGIAGDIEVCEELARRLEIEGGGENAGEFVQAVFQDWAIQNRERNTTLRDRLFLKSIGLTAKPETQEGKR